MSRALSVTHEGTIVLGLGFPTLIPDHGSPAVTVADIDSVTLAGLIVEAGPQRSLMLIDVGGGEAGKSHTTNPTALFDITCRVGGASAGSTHACMMINSDDVILDNVWLWRADHGEGVGWDVNTADIGLIVNGANVNATGLFVEHFQQHQVLWNGDNGIVALYQSELPYDVPSQASWMNGPSNGWADFKVADNVTKFSGAGFGIYCYFNNPVVLETAIEAPSVPGVTFDHVVTRWFTNSPASAINSILNGTGAAVNASNPGATL